MATVSRIHHRIDTTEGVLTWLEVMGPRGPIRQSARLDGHPISPGEMQLRLLSFYLVERGVS